MKVSFRFLHLMFYVLLLTLLGVEKGYAFSDEYFNVGIGGTISGSREGNVRLLVFSPIPGEEGGDQSIQLDESGRFRFALFIPEATEASLLIDDKVLPLYLEPGYEINLQFNLEDIKRSLKVSGQGGRENQYTILADQLFGFTEKELEKMKRQGDEAFASRLSEWRAKRLTFLNENKPVLSTAFVNAEESNIDYLWANQLYSLVEGNEGQRRFKKLPESYFAFFDELKLHQYELIFLTSYRSFLEHYLDYSYRRLPAEEQPQEAQEYYRFMYQLTKQHLRSLPKYHMQAFFLVKAIGFLGVDAVVDEYIEFANECPKQAYKNVLHNMVKAQTVDPIEEPEVIFTDRQGRTVALKELAGSVVLIRFETEDAAAVSEEETPKYDSLDGMAGLRVLDLRLQDNHQAFEKLVYADASDYLKSIMNRPKPGEERKLPRWGYVLLDQSGQIVSNSLDDPENSLSHEKVKALLRSTTKNTSAAN